MNNPSNRPRQSEPPVIQMGPRRGGGPMSARMNAEKPKNTKKTVGRLLHYIGRSGVILVALLAIMLLVTAADVFGPFFQAKAIDTISKDELTGRLTVDLDALWGYLITMAVIFAVSAVLSYFQEVLAAKLSQRTVRMMRNDLFRKISRLPIRYTDTHRHGDIMSRMTNDVENVSNAISQSVSALLSCVLTIVGALSMMLYYSPLMTLIAMVTIPISIFISSKLGKFMRKYFVRQQKLLGQLNGQVEETVTSYKTVVA
ncbi:MAG: ABC transporter ATP-binding protein, partial [Clostridia bacterium]|nr:ABC transporter ATP-binding protein [Clostridia bacterium]